MHTDGDELIPSVNDWPAEAVFMGSGLTAARRPGMTIKRLSPNGFRADPHISS